MRNFVRQGTRTPRTRRRNREVARTVRAESMARSTTAYEVFGGTGVRKGAGIEVATVVGAVMRTAVAVNMSETMGIGLWED